MINHFLDLASGGVSFEMYLSESAFIKALLEWFFTIEFMSHFCCWKLLDQYAR